jgi:hypothetical protein
MMQQCHAERSLQLALNSIMPMLATSATDRDATVTHIAYTLLLIQYLLLTVARLGARHEVGHGIEHDGSVQSRRAEYT